MTNCKHEEMIVEYLVDKDGNYEYFDNHGTLIRCKDCKYYNYRMFECILQINSRNISETHYCGFGKKKEM